MSQRGMFRRHVPRRTFGEVRKRLGAGDIEPLIVVDADRVVLGLVTSELLNADPQNHIEDVMDPAPS
jgi:Mg/Co/Ni transporter MgtE